MFNEKAEGERACDWALSSPGRQQPVGLKGEHHKSGCKETAMCQHPICYSTPLLLTPTALTP